MTEHAPIDTLLSLTGRVAVVPGAGAGIGAAIAGRLVEAGAHVVVADVDPAAASAVAEKITSTHGSDVAGAVAVDVADSPAVDELADTAMRRWGRLDVWVNNAAIFPVATATLDTDDATAEAMWAVNVGGVLAGARAAAARMSDGGVIVNLSSTNGSRGGRGVGVYSATKHAVEGLTKSLALELGGAGIRVVGVAPGLIDTPGVQIQRDALGAVGVDLDARLHDNALGRAGTPDDIARVVLFAVSDLAGWVTGTVIAADAGRTAR